MLVGWFLAATGKVSEKHPSKPLEGTRLSICKMCIVLYSYHVSFGSQVIINTDNRPLTFRCVLFFGGKTSLYIIDE